VDDFWAAKSQDVGIIVRAISFQDFSTYVVMIHQRHRQTDRQTNDMWPQDCTLHYHSISLYFRQCAHRTNSKKL